MKPVALNWIILMTNLVGLILVVAGALLGCQTQAVESAAPRIGDTELCDQRIYDAAIEQKRGELNAEYAAEFVVMSGVMTKIAVLYDSRAGVCAEIIAGVIEGHMVVKQLPGFYECEPPHDAATP